MTPSRPLSSDTYTTRTLTAKGQLVVELAVPAAAKGPAACAGTLLARGDRDRGVSGIGGTATTGAEVTVTTLGVGVTVSPAADAVGAAVVGVAAGVVAAGVAVAVDSRRGGRIEPQV